MTPPDFSAWIRQAQNLEFQIQAGRGNGSGHKRHFDLVESEGFPTCSTGTLDIFVACQLESKGEMRQFRASHGLGCRQGVIPSGPETIFKI